MGRDDIRLTEPDDDGEIQGQQQPDRGEDGTIAEMGQREIGEDEGDNAEDEPTPAQQDPE